jgi:imidazolonepropionase-like amidohydrolase
MQALEAGITTARDCGGLSRVIFPLKQAVEEGIIPGPRIIACGEAITVTAGHCHFLEMEAEGITAVQRAVRMLHERGADFIKVMATGGGATPGSNVRLSQYSAAELEAMAADAHRIGKKITAHAHGTQGIRLLVDAGFDGIEHCSWVPREGDGFEYDDAYAKNIRDRGMVVCRSIAGFERWPLEECGPGHKAWDSYEPLRLMVNDGITLVAGTDAGIDYTDFAGLNTSLETMIGLGGMDHARVFCSATIDAAAALGMADCIGSLDIGKKADCIGVAGNPAEDIRALRAVFFVMKDGKTEVDRTIVGSGEK